MQVAHFTTIRLHLMQYAFRILPLLPCPANRPGLILLCLLLCSPIPPALTDEEFALPEDFLVQTESQYGREAGQRLRDWEQFIRAQRESSEQEKLEATNRFFNKIAFLDDAIHWKKKDYWATPMEFLASNGGDCEDFALAKYFTLKMLGMADDKLSLTYVKALRLNQAHMVLTYYPTPGAEPLVLDNLAPAIMPASERDDLLPVYSFNGSSLWLAKQRGRGQLVGRTEQLRHWRDLMERMPEAFKDQAQETLQTSHNKQHSVDPL